MKFSQNRMMLISLLVIGGLEYASAMAEPVGLLIGLITGRFKKRSPRKTTNHIDIDGDAGNRNYPELPSDIKISKKDLQVLESPSDKAQPTNSEGIIEMGNSPVVGSIHDLPSTDYHGLAKRPENSAERLERETKSKLQEPNTLLAGNTYSNTFANLSIVEDICFQFVKYNSRMTKQQIQDMYKFRTSPKYTKHTLTHQLIERFVLDRFCKSDFKHLDYAIENQTRRYPESRYIRNQVQRAYDQRKTGIKFNEFFRQSVKYTVSDYHDIKKDVIEQLFLIMNEHDNDKEANDRFDCWIQKRRCRPVIKFPTNAVCPRALNQIIGLLQNDHH